MPFQVNTVKKSEILGRSSMQNLVSNKRINSKSKWCLKNIKTVCQTDVLRFTGYYTNCKVSQNSHLLSTPGNCLGTWIRHLGPARNSPLQSLTRQAITFNAQRGFPTSLPATFRRADSYCCSVTAKHEPPCHCHSTSCSPVHDTKA